MKGKVIKIADMSKLHEKKGFTLMVHQVNLCFNAKKKVAGTEGLEEDLNRAKSKYDDLDQKRLSNIMRELNLYRILNWQLTKKFNAQFPTNAFEKCYEMVKIFNIKYTSVFCNAELPGAFVFALNHYNRTHNKEFEWVASSLVNKKEGALDDQFGLVEHNPDKWLMTDTNNGDVGNIENLLDIEKRVKPVDLYTHDIGKPMEDFSKQEEEHIKIQLGAAICGFMTLKKGGAFIGKQFTFFNQLSKDLILIYASMFNKFYIHKPLTSKPANSEIYLVGIEFKGFEHRDILLQKLQNFDFKPLLDAEYLQLLGAENILYNKQIQYIEESVKYYHKYEPQDLKTKLYKLKQDIANSWIKDMKFKTISESMKLKSKKRY